MSEKSGKAPNANDLLKKIQRVAGGDLVKSRRNVPILDMGGPLNISLCYFRTSRTVRAFMHTLGQKETKQDFTNWADLRTFLIENKGLGPDYPYPDEKKAAKE